MDLDKLTQRPWAGVRRRYRDTAEETGDFALAGGADGLDCIATFERETDCDFAALAATAFDVMMRRGWGVVGDDDGKWFVISRGQLPGGFFNQDHCGSFADPFTALVEADRWYRENVEKP